MLALVQSKTATVNFTNIHTTTRSTLQQKREKTSTGEYSAVNKMFVVELVVVGTFTALTLLDVYMIKKLYDGKAYRVHVNSKYHLAGDGSYLL